MRSCFSVVKRVCRLLNRLAELLECLSGLVEAALRPSERDGETKHWFALAAETVLKNILLASLVYDESIVVE